MQIFADLDIHLLGKKHGLKSLAFLKLSQERKWCWDNHINCCHVQTGLLGQSSQKN
jgi:hypothetical protein